MYPPTIKIEFIVSLKHFEIIPFGFGCVKPMSCVFDGSFFDSKLKNIPIKKEEAMWDK